MGNDFERENNLNLSDKEQLIKAMGKIGEGIFELVDANAFSDVELADAYNEMLDKIIKRNNHYLARINDAQMRIGDNSSLKSMLEQIDIQQEVIRNIQESRNGLEINESSMEESNAEFLALSQQIKNGFGPCLSELKEVVAILESVPVPDEDSEEAKGNAVMWTTLAELKRTVISVEKRIEGLERRVTSMSYDARHLFGVIDRKSNFNNTFIESVDSLTQGFKNLSMECLGMGRYLYRISRDVDNARNDMFRHNAKPTLHDTLRVFEVDHLTLTWRLYNNIVEFENLRLTQVNNPTGCKFGVWISSVTDQVLLDSEQFGKIVSTHEELHRCCVECFMAKQAYDNKLAIQKFGEAMEAFNGFKNAMEDFHEFLREIGITKETDVWKFRG